MSQANIAETNAALDEQEAYIAERKGELHRPIDSEPPNRPVAGNDLSRLPGAARKLLCANKSGLRATTSRIRDITRHGPVKNGETPGRTGRTRTTGGAARPAAPT